MIPPREGDFPPERHPVKERSSWDTVTQREKEVLKLVAEGYTSKEIAAMLCNSPKTIEYRFSLNRKG